MPAISIIVPVYQAEPYLTRCIDSILAQTFTDFELILVDDGSPDRCPAICDEYAAHFSRIHVIHQHNRGLSAARNAGIDWAFIKSDSAWLTFVDSDDWIHPQYLEKLLHAAAEYDAAISICGYTQTDGQEPDLPNADLPPSAWTPENFFLADIINATVAWGKLYRKHCFREIRYPVGRIHEDEFTTYKILFSETQIAVTPAPLYCYFQNPEGITKRLWSPARLDYLDAIEQQLLFYEENHLPRMLKMRLKAAFTSMRIQLDQIQAASQETGQHYTKYQRYTRKKMRSLYLRYRSLYVISLRTDPWIFEGIAPHFMNVYWRIQYNNTPIEKS